MVEIVRPRYLLLARRRSTIDPFSSNPLRSIMPSGQDGDMADGIDINALAEALRATMADLDRHIEERAQILFDSTDSGPAAVARTENTRLQAELADAPAKYRGEIEKAERVIDSLTREQARLRYAARHLPSSVRAAAGIRNFTEKHHWALSENWRRRVDHAMANPDEVVESPADLLHISELDLSTVLRRKLSSAGIDTIGELRNTDPGKILGIGVVGERAVADALYKFDEENLLRADLDAVGNSSDMPDSP
ncbi:hypothetical protein J4573_08680 [Actinomadura barringtoniae]|uniref:Uncharacterized protein n=1 Tax=Actinomadura barringtoniae TaxID=1427535 RepID=A0A939T3S8_9ACTN|nr:hypothetical protein [Actinomadura barringtoniae]MBO2447159.1 hypothetical protein [Actinomadura barringtoniae]